MHFDDRKQQNIKSISFPKTYLDEENRKLVTGSAHMWQEDKTQIGMKLKSEFSYLNQNFRIDCVSRV